jgi:hypothetical protein
VSKILKLFIEDAEPLPNAHAEMVNPNLSGPLRPSEPLSIAEDTNNSGQLPAPPLGETPLESDQKETHPEQHSTKGRKPRWKKKEKSNPTDHTGKPGTGEKPEESNQGIAPSNSAALKETEGSKMQQKLAEKPEKNTHHLEIPGGSTGGPQKAQSQEKIPNGDQEDIEDSRKTDPPLEQGTSEDKRSTGESNSNKANEATPNVKAAQIKEESPEPKNHVFNFGEDSAPKDHNFDFGDREGDADKPKKFFGFTTVHVSHGLPAIEESAYLNPIGALHSSNRYI